jgi:putative DNA primase/helicase
LETDKGDTLNFIEHAAAHGLLIRDLIADGRWHRVPTMDKPRKRNGAYVFDGQKGAVRNWATMAGFAPYRNGHERPVVARDLEEIRRREQEREAWLRAHAREEAEELIRSSSYETHPYLIDKGFPKERGFVKNSELLIPMRDLKNYRVIHGVQRITKDYKRFLKGQQSKGAVFKLGVMQPDETWLCEGYATGLSVRAALNDLRCNASIYICFSAGNLSYVAPMVKPPVYIMADNDASGVGAQAAVESGLPWVMPPEVGMDANDWHLSRGLRALVALVLSARRFSWGNRRGAT